MEHSDVSSGDFANKKTVITSQLQRRDEERIADLHKRKEEKENVTASNEKSDFFEEKFNRAIKEVDDGIGMIGHSESLPKGELADHFDKLSSTVQQIQKFLSDSTFFLSAHMVAKSQETLTNLNNAIQEKRDVMLPKKKFAFKSKKKVTETTKSAKPDVVDAKVADSKPVAVELTEVRFTDKTGETLSMSEKDLSSSDVALARLVDCTVKLFGAPSTLHMNNLTGCTILCGPVSSSVFVDNCKNCTFVTPCQQLRVHTTTDCTFYLHVTSRAIIEDSNSLYFAPYNLTYSGIDEHYKQSGLDRSRNNWDDVDDFNWLASDAHSPNWGVLEAVKRTENWNI